MKNQFAEFCAAVRAQDSFVIACHVSPDPDAIGSAAALQQVLTAAGKQAVLLLPEPYRGPLEPYLDEVTFIHTLEEIPDGAAAFVVDTATKARTFAPEGFFERTPLVFVLDHHGSNPSWGTRNFIDESAAATAQLVVRLATELQVMLSASTASLLYAGLSDDTGSFRYSNTSSEAFHVAAKLLDAGVNPEELANALFFTLPERVLKLRALALSTLQTHCDGQVASIYVTAEMLASTNTNNDDCDGIVDIARSLQGVRCALFFRERSEGWRVSLRAKDEHLDVNAVAAVFSGGGHRAAAGCTIVAEEITEVRAAVLDEVEKQLS